MTLSLKNKTVAPGDVVSYEIAIDADGNAGTHTLRMDVIDPAGNESGPYSRNITAANGKAAGRIPLALNDRPGQWQVRLKDLTSGKAADIRFTVTP